MAISPAGGPLRESEWRTAQVAGQRTVGPLRGGKWSVYEGGFQVPFIVWWPGIIEPQSVNPNLVSVVDIFAAMADLLEVDYPQNAGEDSFSFWPQLVEGPIAPAPRDHVFVQSALGVRAIFKDGWKWIRPWTPPAELTETDRQRMRRELTNLENYPQLYTLEQDPRETTNLIRTFPATVRQLDRQLKAASERERTAID